MRDAHKRLQSLTRRFAELARADSKGRFVSEVIKRYPFRKLQRRA